MVTTTKPVRSAAGAAFLLLFWAVMGGAGCDARFFVGEAAPPDGGVLTPSTVPDAAASPVAPACKLVFDLSHGQERFSNPENFVSAHGWGPTVAMLTAWGYGWRINRDPIVQIDTGEAWIFSEPTVALESVEIAALIDFVRRGGALLLATDITVDTLNPLASAFGATFDGVAHVTDFVRLTDFVGEHPVTAALTSVAWPMGSTLTINDPLVTTVARFQGRPAIAAVGNEAGGRVLLVSDNEVFARAGLEGVDDPTPPAPRSNTQFLANVAAWLTGCAPRNLGQ